MVIYILCFEFATTYEGGPFTFLMCEVGSPQSSALILIYLLFSILHKIKLYPLLKSPTFFRLLSSYLKFYAFSSYVTIYFLTFLLIHSPYG